MTWKKRPLGEVANIDRSGISPELISDGTIYVGLENMTGDGTFLDVREVDNGELASTKFTFNEKHVLYGKLRPYLRKTTRPNFNGVCSTDILPILAGPDLNRDFLYHFLRLPETVNLATTRSAGANLPRISPRVLEEFEIPLPPLDEQKRIAEVLDKADALRQKRRLALQKLDSLLQSVFLDMFGDPVTNPKGWKQAKLGSLCDVGSSRRVFVDELVEEGVPFYRGTEVGALGSGEAVTPALFITQQHYEELRKETGVPTPGDLLLPSICPDGRIYIVGDERPFYFKDGRVLWIKAGESGINSVFLRYHLKHVFAANYAKIASGTTFAELKIFALKGLVVQVPPPERQEHFARFVDRCDSQILHCRGHLAKLESFLAALQSHAFKGELFKEVQ